jgi:hypothetical protein
MANRWAWWAAATVCGAAGIALVAVAVLVDLDTAEKFASIGGGVIALFGFAVMIRGLLESPGSGAPSGGSGQAAPSPSAGGGSTRKVQVTAKTGGMAAVDGIHANSRGIFQRLWPRSNRERPQNEEIIVSAEDEAIASGGGIYGIGRRTPEPPSDRERSAGSPPEGAAS